MVAMQRKQMCGSSGRRLVEARGCQVYTESSVEGEQVACVYLKSVQRLCVH